MPDRIPFDYNYDTDREPRTERRIDLFGRESFLDPNNAALSGGDRDKERRAAQVLWDEGVRRAADKEAAIREAVGNRLRGQFDLDRNPPSDFLVKQMADDITGGIPVVKGVDPIGGAQQRMTMERYGLVKPSGLGAARSAPRKPTNDQAASQLDELSKGVQGMRSAGPRKDIDQVIAERVAKDRDETDYEQQLLTELANMRGGVAGMRNADVRDHNPFVLMNEQDRLRGR